ncbi:MAG: PucR family transcriptional regulator ligand-binding domain-containing protein [Anaerolineae bacterium]|jgi:purine catabolism regulator|nr:PucR family transcriptional regulator ligand-binding domain-containing protein [Anaerolineae bacterium]
MHLTVAQAIELEVLAGARCVGGHAGLSREVKWVHNVGVPDAANWLNGGEFVLTTYINLPPSQAEQEEYVRALAEKGVAALGLTYGRFIPEVPPYLCATADALGLPLIAVPYQLMFVDIARTINMQLAQREVREALSIQQALTRLVMEEDSDLRDLAVTLARLLNQSVSIENERFEAFAAQNVADVDEARRYTQKQGRTDPRLIHALEDRGYLPLIRQTLRPTALPRMPDVGLEMERILAPVVVHGEIYGYLWIIADAHPFSELERMAVESGATIAALMLLRQEKAQREAASERAEFLSRLLTPKAAEREDMLIDRAHRYGLNLRAPYRILCVDGLRATVRSVAYLERLLTSHGYTALTGQHNDQLVLLTADSPHALDIAAAVVAAQSSDPTPTRVAVSSAARAVSGALRAVQECRDSLAVAARLAPSDRLIRAEMLGYLLALWRAGSDALHIAPHADALRALRDLHGADLFHTLEVYLDLGGSGIHTAEALHIHRSTLNYRLGRITEHLGVDLGDPTQRINLQTALKLLRLFE